MKTQNLRFINQEARTWHALQEALSGAPLKQVEYEPLFGPVQVRMTQQAYEAVEDYVYMQTLAGLDLGARFWAADVEPDWAHELPLTLEQVEALIRLVGTYPAPSGTKNGA